MSTNPNLIKIVHWNCQSLNNKISDLENFILQLNIDIICLNEVWLDENQANRFKFRNFNCIFNCRDGRGGGVAILVNQKFKVFQIPLRGNIYNKVIETVAAEIHINNFKFNLVSAYFPHISRINSSCLTEWFKNIKNHNLIITGDLNASSPTWGSSHFNPRGQVIQDFLDANDLVVLNTGSPTRFGPNSSSCLDVTVASQNISTNCSWATFNDTLGSDHCPTITTLNLNNYRNLANNINVPKLIPRNINRKLFQKKLEERLVNLPNDLASNYEVFTNEVFESASIRNNPRCIRKAVAWWSADCSRAVARRRLAFGRYKSNPSIANWNNLKIEERTCKYILKHAKKGGWRKKCEALSYKTRVGSMWILLNCFKGHGNISRSLSMPGNWADSYALYLIGPIGPINTFDNVNWVFRDSALDLNSVSFLLNDFSLEELEVSLNIAKNKAPGLDQINFSVLKALPMSAKLILLNIYNDILQGHVIPVDWFNFVIIPIKKPDRNCNSFSAFRPIALIVCIRKLFENMLKIRIDYYVEKNDLLPESQLGFRKGRSVVDSITGLWLEANSALADKDFMIAVFLDIKGAFDNIEITSLCQHLIDVKFPIVIAKLIYNLFNFRNLMVKMGSDQSSNYSCYRGVPQGSPLSPILFNLCFSKIGCINEFGCKMYLYADDIVITSRSSQLNVAVSQMQNILQKTYIELTKIGLEIESNKSKCMIFSRGSAERNPIIALSVNNQVIKQVTDTKFLGFVLQHNLSCNLQINNIINKGNKIINIMKALAGVWWGSHPSVLLIVYKTMLRQSIDFCSHLFQDTNAEMLLKLDRLQWKAIRIALGAMISTHTLSLEAEANIMPLKLRRKLLTQKYLSKRSYIDIGKIMETLSSIPLELKSIYSIQVVYNSFLEIPIFSSIKLPYYTLSYDALFLKLNIFFANFSQNSNESSASQLQKLLDLRWPLCRKVYTDGSKTNSKTGCAFYSDHDEIEAQFSLNLKSNVYSAECTAILEALKYISLQNYTHFLILSDSKSCLSALCHFPSTNTHPLIFQIRQLLFELSTKGFIVSLLWIPAHAGILGNEIADQLAKTVEFDVTTSNSIVYHLDLEHDFRVEAVNDWQSLWNNSDKGRRFYSIKPKINKAPWFETMLNKRSDINAITRLRFGHVICGEHLFRLNIISDPGCPDCGASVETIDHVLLHCSHNSSPWKNLFIRKIVYQFGIKVNMLSILKNEHLLVYEELARYLKRMNFKL
jgi:exonuclease III/ribonuclease HI